MKRNRIFAGSLIALLLTLSAVVIAEVSHASRNSTVSHMDSAAVSSATPTATPEIWEADIRVTSVKVVESGGELTCTVTVDNVGQQVCASSLFAHPATDRSEIRPSSLDVLPAPPRWKVGTVTSIHEILTGLPV